mmetsp:Transcript_42001/g.48716  ORF Transcript_42001/g.48716 Transcript_42001/m.48716 type:complete len:238 (+) Transcript_42001:25-738(+)
MNVYTGKASMLEKQKQEAMKKQAYAQALDQKKAELKKVYEEFQASLLNFAKERPKEIKKNPESRSKFNQMCLDLGIDPMVSKKTMWSDIGFGDYYSELAIKIYRILISKRKTNGGLMKISDVVEVYNKRSKDPEDKIQRDDVKKALESISELGSACTLKGEYICSVPIDLSDDSMDLLTVAEEHGYVSAALLAKARGWPEERFKRQINQMLSEGLVWIDSQAAGGPHYYFPSMWIGK